MPTHGENTFRILFILVFCLSIAVAHFHRIKAKTGERLARREEGVLLFIVLRLAGLAMWTGALAYVINPAWMTWAQLGLPDWVRWIGAALGLLCPVLLYWTLRHLGKNLTDTVVTRANASLVTTGPYHWVRHPFYVCVALLILSSFLLTANWSVGLGGLIVLVMLAVRTPIEECKLVERFGDEYRRYTERTGRFFPRLRR